ncbi:MAG: ABC transporter ATP-binding protein/permease [Lachnospiraceae bacterium]|nr:ABC transporter ATP-binding protein/permease [Lachnospiraceae bacterium]MDD7627730.1 ABC transporter ATP-binding protein [Lachnospiraceae bacterium]MDY4117741.1 ABC transporter ATP-binding protein [Lachnospiraceae bacterium]
MEKKDKLSLKQTLKNAWYALTLGASISKSIVIHSFFLWLVGYCEWVFFDGIFMRKIVDALDQGRGFRPIFLFILLSGVAFCAASVYTNYVENVVYPLETNRLFGGIYRKLYEKAKNVELRCYEDSDFYNRYTMAMDGAEEKITAIIRGVLGTVIGSVSAVVVFWFMYEIDHYAMLFIVCPLLGNFVFGNLKNKYEYKRYQEQAPNEKVLNYVSRMMYLPDGAKEIRLSEVFSLMKKQYREATDRNVRIAVKYAFANASLSFWRITFTFTVIFEGVLLYAIYRKQVTGSITLAQLTIMTSLMVAMTWILIRVFESIMEILKNGVFINNLRTFLAYEETIPEDQDGDMPEKEFQSIEFREVSFSYKDEQTIQDLSFVITKGQAAALVGHNGAGKTTIIKLLLRLYDPTSGTIFYNGRDIREYNLKAYRELFATTFQDFQMFGMTIKENVLMGRHYEKEEELVIAALKKAGVYEKVSSLEKGIDTMMTKEFDEDGAVLSGGESQKIAVARTFVKDAPMKIFDEPSSALDPIAEYELFQNIMKEGSDHTMLFISHRLSSVKNCDKVFMLEKGHLIEEGTHSELMAANGSYAQMYKKQAMNYLALENEEEVKL